MANLILALCRFDTITAMNKLLSVKMDKYHDFMMDKKIHTSTSQSSEL
jgi:hypothetical protein